MLVRCKGEDRQDPAWDEPAGAQKLDLAEGDLVAVIDGRYNKKQLFFKISSFVLLQFDCANLMQN